MSEGPELEYAIAEGASVEELTTRVNKLIAEGWYPHGGMAAGVGAYFQPVVRVPEEGGGADTAASAMLPRRSHRSAVSKL